MKSYSASRLINGNGIFPSRIIIDDSSVTFIATYI